jgi:hypothetical protein
MFKAIGAFLTVFALLSLMVHLERMVLVLGMGALGMFAVDLLVAKFPKSPRPGCRRNSSSLPIIKL